jgi:hypothetical protein
MKIWTAHILLFSGTLVLTVHAADYYVSSIHTNRNDLNAGTFPDAPWATMGKVENESQNFSPGDTVYLERGSVFEIDVSHSASNTSFLKMHAGGTPGQPITVTGSGYGTGALPVIRRTGGTGSPSLIHIQKSYITVNDIEIDGGNSTYGTHTTGIVIGGHGEDLSNVTIRNLKIHNLGGNLSTYICGIWVSSFTSNIVSDCLIEGNEVSDYSAHGLNHYSHGPMINITWRNNIVRNTYYGGRYPSANSALQISSGSRGCLFEHNYLEDTTTTESIIFGFGKQMSDSGLNTIRHNIIAYSNKYGILFTKDQPGQRLLYDVYENIIYYNSYSGIAVSPYDSYASGTRFRIYNNTFFNNCTAGGDVTRGDIELEGKSSNTTIEVVNNLIYHRNYSDTVGLSVGSGFNGGLLHRNNLYWHPGGSSINIVYDRGDHYTVGNVTTFEASAQNTNPFLLDIRALPISTSTSSGVSPDGLKPQTGSPAIYTGTVGISDADIEGTAISFEERRDIGAYEIFSNARIMLEIVMDEYSTTAMVQDFADWRPRPEFQTNLLVGDWVPLAASEFTSTYPVSIEGIHFLIWTNLPYKNIFFRVTYEP